MLKPTIICRKLFTSHVVGSLAMERKEIMRRIIKSNASAHAYWAHEFIGHHSRPQRPRSFWSAPRIATSGQVHHRKSAIHGLPVTLRMFRVKFDKSDWFWSQSIVFTKPFKNGMSLD